MKYKNLSEQMEAKGYKLKTWARAKGLSDTDFMILYQLNLGAMLGRWGRGAELRKLLEAEGFDTSFLDEDEYLSYKTPCNGEAVVVG